MLPQAGADAGSKTPTGPQTKLSIEDIVVEFATEKQRVRVLDGFELTVGEGEFVSILGPSGCGKSTLLKVVAGLMEQNQGRIRIEGQIIKGYDSRVGMIFQEYALFPWLTLRENVEFGLRVKGLPRKERAERSQRFIELVRLQGFENHYPQQLSGGMKQRAALARALVMDPEILLMDEPLAALDAQTRITLQDEILAIAQKTRKTILYVTHSVDESVFLSDRVVVSTARPGRVKEIIEIDLPKPRDRTNSEFLLYEARTLKSVREEVIKMGEGR
ncbi:MAG: ABC transporter ATP-binding protein [Chloroflexi bacterium]|nr:ABC transporter ATP-binding protein [Chloroflexota bacterium]MDA8188579.1 ABC transporter ATP-binding protein [Dehalococcoidales bacterium]